MTIIDLDHGDVPPPEADCIRIYPAGEGAFVLTGTALCEGDSVSLVPGAAMASEAEAREAGIAWANGMNVATLYIALDPRATEADLPL